MDDNLTKEYPEDFLATWAGCVHLDCLPRCRHGMESGFCERLEKAFIEYQARQPRPRHLHAVR